MSAVSNVKDIQKVLKMSKISDESICPGVDSNPRLLDLTMSNNDQLKKIDNFCRKTLLKRKTKSADCKNSISAGFSKLFALF